MKNLFIKTLSLYFTFFLISLNSTGQNRIKYGANYAIIESEDTSSNLGLWKLRTPEDPDYLKYYNPPSFSPNEPAPINETYLEFTGNTLNGGSPKSPIEYKFTAPSTGNYRIGIRMHQPLELDSNGELEKGDKRNDLWLKLQGNYTTSSNFKQSTLTSFHKFWGRGPSKWGTIHTLEGENNNGNDANAVPNYNLIEGEEYTMTLAGRAQGCSIDYIVIFEPIGIADVDIINGKDLAQTMPEEYRPNKIEDLNTVSFVTTPDTFVNNQNIDIALNYQSSNNNNELVIILNDPDNKWIASKKLPISIGSGSATLSINLTTPPDTNENYILRAQIRPIGSKFRDGLDTIESLITFTSTTTTPSASFYIVNKRTQKKLGSQNSTDGSEIVQLNATTESDAAKWIKRDAGDGYYYLQNVATSMHFRPEQDVDASSIIQRPNSYLGDFTKWKEVPTSNGYFYLENKATDKYFRPENNNDNSIVILRPKTYSGNYTQWKFESTDNTPSSIVNKTNRKIDIFPNPASGSDIYITPPSDFENYSIRIFNFQGQLVSEKLNNSDQTNISINELKKGIYLVEIYNGENRTLKKILVE